MKKNIFICILGIVFLSLNHVLAETFQWNVLTSGGTTSKTITELSPDNLTLTIRDLTSIKSIFLGNATLDLTGLSNSINIGTGANAETTINVVEILQTSANNFLIPTSNQKFQIKIVDNSDKSHTFIFEYTAPQQVIGQLQMQEEIATYVKLKYGTFAYIYKEPKNNLIKAGKTIHIFIDEFGKTYFSGSPTTAREDFNYTLHLFYYEEKVDKKFEGIFEGVYEPTFEVYGSEFLANSLRGSTSSLASSEKAENDEKVKVKEITFENKGPFTSSFTLRIKKIVTENKKDTEIILVNNIIKVAKTHHISLTAGLVSSFLSNPTNFEKFPLTNGDTTVIADDPKSRGLITLMATFYPKPRNLLFAPTNFLERIGFVVGTRIDKDFNENFLGGISIDLARGVSLSGGLHYGRVNRLAEHSSFNYGTDKFEGELKTKKQWELGGYVGVNIDLRVFGLLFNPQPQ